MCVLETTFRIAAQDATGPAVAAAGGNLKKVAIESEAAAKRAAAALKSLAAGNAANATRQVNEATAAVRRAAKTAETEVVGLGTRLTTLQRIMLAGVGGAVAGGVAVIGNMAKDAAQHNRHTSYVAFAERNTCSAQQPGRPGAKIWGGKR